MAKVLQFWNLAPAPGGCPFAHRAWLALEEKKIKHEKRIVSKENKPQDFLDAYHSVWPDKEKNATVPTIIDTDGTTVTESQVVVEYLEQRYKGQGTQLIPTDPAHAAKARMFGELFTSNFAPGNHGIMFSKTQQEVADAKAKLVHGLQVLDTFLTTQALQGGPFVLGEHYSIAEVSSAPFVWRTTFLAPHYRNIDVFAEAKARNLNRFLEWTQAVLERPSTRDTAIPHEAIIEAWKPMVPKLS
ncbi:hypothetical protein WJX73_002714 [Symbiochloris irregularis]|uniref:Glutathione S-transferase n=1 Tax=Symbiochloris irregularis TaxID=706552 RepID=A0AAW1PRS5_9CHLO